MITLEQTSKTLAANDWAVDSNGLVKVAWIGALQAVPREELAATRSDGSTPIIYVATQKHSTLSRDALGHWVPSRTETKHDWPSEPTTFYDFTFGADGRRVVIQKTQLVGDQWKVVEVRTRVMDDNNPTGYSQVLEERTASNASGGVTVANATAATPDTYLLGMNVTGQWLASDTALSYFVYDGHGSVRGLVDGNGLTNTAARFDFDAFGNALAFDPNAASTKLLYSGQLWDTANAGYDNRFRVYDPTSGRFTSLDDWQGRYDDPESLDKYLYTGADPVSGIDPSGHMDFSLTSFLMTTGISAVAGGIVGASIGAARAYAAGATWDVMMEDAFLGGAIGFAAGGLIGAGSYLGVVGISQAVGSLGATATFSDAFAKTFVGFHLSAIGLAAGADQYEQAIESGNEFEQRLAIISMLASGFGLISSRVGMVAAGVAEIPRQELIAALPPAIKISPARVIDITRASNGQTVWIELGNENAGFEHILMGHEQDFANNGVPNYMIPRLIMRAVSAGRIVGQEGSGRNTRTIYEVDFNGRTQKLAVGVGSNGYVVTAFPK
jgi:RHS repeat-associated protein